MVHMRLTTQERFAVSILILIFALAIVGWCLF
jgi:hypothetical protein